MTDETAATGSGPVRIADLGRGTNQSGVRLYNERLVLSLIRRHTNLPKAEIARLTGLSAQTVSVIMNQLEADGLILKQEPQRGRIGQPSVPFALNPNGALSLGLKVGRRSSNLVLVDFVGGVRAQLSSTYPYPSPSAVLEFARQAIPELTDALPRSQSTRLSGLGVAIPFELWNWAEEIGAPPLALEAWRTFDIQAEIAKLCRWPVHLCNDATAACAAELVFGDGGQYLELLYVFVGWFIGGGVVLNGTLFPGRSGNAGALGSMPVAAAAPSERRRRQLIRSASLHVLERKLIAAQKDPGIIWSTREDWAGIGGVLDEWIDEASESIAYAITAASSVIDFQAVILDGAFPATVRELIVERTTQKIEGFDRRGLSPVLVRPGTIGRDARAIGGASLPLLANFARDREILFKESA